MILLIEQAEKCAVRSLYDDRAASFPDFQQGDTIPLSVGLLRRITQPWNSRLFTPQDISDWAIRATIETEVVASLETDSEEPEIVVTEEQAGDATHNHKVSLALPTLRYDGAWTFATEDGESGLIGWGDNAAEIKAKLETTEGIGTGNVEVEQTGDDTFLIEFVGDLALTAIDGIAADGSTLKVIGLKSGTMDLRTAGIAALFADSSDDRVVKLTILGTPAGTEQVLLQRDILLRAFAGEYELSQPIDVLGVIPLPLVTGFIGAGPTNLEGAARTVGRPAGTVFRVIVAIGGQRVLSEWEVNPGTEDTDLAAGIIRPLDYDADDNPVNLILVSGTAV